MKLSDLKKYSARKRTEVSFRLPNGMECVVDMHGIARVPQLKGVPDFNLEECVSSAEAFSVRQPGSDKGQNVTRADVEKLISALGGSAATAADHDD